MISRGRALGRLALMMHCAGVGGCALCPVNYGAVATIVTHTANSEPDSRPLAAVIGSALEPLGYPAPTVPTDRGFVTTTSALGPSGYRLLDDNAWFFPPSAGLKLWQTPNDVIVIVNQKAGAVLLTEHFGHPTEYTRKVEAAIIVSVRQTYGANVRFTPHPVHNCVGP